jgi:hypothetical protein
VAAPLRRILAADAAIRYSATTLLRTGAPDNTTAVRAVVRDRLRTAATVAFGRDVDASQVWITDDHDPPVLFVRSRRDELVLAGKVPVRWAALDALGLADVEAGLVLDAEVDASLTVVRLAGYRFARRDPDVTPFVVDVPAAFVEGRIRSALDGAT